MLYLDLDGVVHHHAVYQDRRRGIYMSPTEAPGRRLFEWADLLVELLRPYPSIGLVLSSSWCRRPGYARTLKLLPSELRARFVGGTFHRSVHGADQGAELEFASLPRGVQIARDVARRRPRGWLALDDDGIGWPDEHRVHLLLCDGRVGISAPATQNELLRRMSNMVNPIRDHEPDAIIDMFDSLDGPDQVAEDLSDPAVAARCQAAEDKWRVAFPTMFQVVRSGDLHELASNVFETVDEAEAWLRRPHPLLDGQAPLEVAATAAGKQRVIDMLVAIKFGGVC
ncbi:HAD domain-containing protein [Paucibacter sp. JuS9]|uniref:HAD domain-containing protein n=1 Tax=Paucibacter sp. JuS9 TaxID=3228748 RepID=UPI003756B755